MKLRYKVLIGLAAFVLVATIGAALVLSYDAPCEPAPEVPPGADAMKAIVYGCYGSPEVLELADVARPVPAENELLVRVHAAAVNPYDWHFLRGSPYLMRLMSGIGSPKDRRTGVDFAGTVEAVGKDVTAFEAGDAVFGGANGAFAEYVTVSEDGSVAPKPDEVSFEEAASVGIAGVTALQALRDAGTIEAGDRVLINGASGGVGTFAVQIARHYGAEVYGVCSTRNVDLVRRLGAQHVFDYKRENYTESGKSFDLIVDMIGNHSLSANRRVLDSDGVLVIVGAPSGDWIAPILPALKAQLVNPFVDEELVTMLARMSAEDLRFLAGLMSRGELTPTIDRRYDLDETAEAIAYSESGRARGKIVIRVAEAAPADDR